MNRAFTLFSNHYELAMNGEEEIDLTAYRGKRSQQLCGGIILRREAAGRARP
jgi:hypothetical protein